MAPEALNKSVFKSDCWSCGAILYLMICGQPPFRGKNFQEIHQNIQKGELLFEESIWSSISDAAKNLI